MVKKRSHPDEFYPAFISPLTDKEHARIGRIAVLWGQIDFIVEWLVNLLTGMSYPELEALQINSKMLSSKAGYVKALSKRLGDQRTREAILAFCTAIEDVKSQRNHVFHGIWGLHCNNKTQTVVAASRKRPAYYAPFKVTSLPGLERKLCACSRLGADCVALINAAASGRAPVRTQFTEMFHSHDESADAQWLEQWQERNPLDVDALDQNAKEGQLPRLTKLRPRK